MIVVRLRRVNIVKMRQRPNDQRKTARKSKAASKPAKQRKTNGQKQQTILGDPVMNLVFGFILGIMANVLVDLGIAIFSKSIPIDRSSSIWLYCAVLLVSVVTTVLIIWRLWVQENNRINAQ